MFSLPLSLLLGWTAVAKTQSRRQSGLVCSLLVVSLLLFAAVVGGGQECVPGTLSEETVNMYGSPSESPPSALNSRIYALPSMNFSCSGTITDIRMRMSSRAGFPASITQELVVYFLLFHDGLNSPTRRVSYILLNHTNTQQESPNLIWNNSNPLSLPVTEGTFIGFAIPERTSPTIYSRNIHLLRTSEQVEAHIYQLATNFSECEVIEAARTVNSSQFFSQTIALPLIDVNFSPSSSIGLPPPPRPHSDSASSCTSPLVSTNTTTPETTPTMPSQLMIIVIAVVVSTVLLVVVVALVAAMVTVLCRRHGNKNVHGNTDANKSVQFQATQNTLQSTDYYEPMSLDVDPTPFQNQPHPLHTPPMNATSDDGDQILMQACPAYQPIVDTPTSGDYTYI